MYYVSESRAPFPALSASCWCSKAQYIFAATIEASCVQSLIITIRWYNCAWNDSVSFGPLSNSIPVRKLVHCDPSYSAHDACVIPYQPPAYSMVSQNTVVLWIGEKSPSISDVPIVSEADIRSTILYHMPEGDKIQAMFRGPKAIAVKTNPKSINQYR